MVSIFSSGQSNIYNDYNFIYPNQNNNYSYHLQNNSYFCVIDKLSYSFVHAIDNYFNN
jgi:hypothetical protein